MGEARRKYTREFKLEAVRLSEDPDRTAAEVARALGITPSILYRWRQAFRSEGPEAFPGHGKLPESEEQMRQLRRELERVRQERDILKKAIAIFSQER
jgi:transposase